MTKLVVTGVGNLVKEIKMQLAGWRGNPVNLTINDSPEAYERKFADKHYGA